MWWNGNRRASESESDDFKFWQFSHGTGTKESTLVPNWHTDFGNFLDLMILPKWIMIIEHK